MSKPILESALVAFSDGSTYSFMEGCQVVIYPDSESLNEVVEKEGDKSLIRNAAQHGAEVLQLDNTEDLLKLVGYLIEKGAPSPFTMENDGIWGGAEDDDEEWDEWEDED